MSYFILEPEIAGGWGNRTVADTNAFPPVVSSLHYRFDGWLGDELLETFPCFIVTERLATRLRRSGFTGFRLQAVEVTTSEEYDALYPDRGLPLFKWLRPVGKAGVDDFGLSATHRLVVSDRALAVLRKFRFRECEVAEFTP
jgi:hypothetical protein